MGHISEFIKCGVPQGSFPRPLKFSWYYFTILVRQEIHQRDLRLSRSLIKTRVEALKWPLLLSRWSAVCVGAQRLQPAGQRDDKPGTVSRSDQRSPAGQEGHKGGVRLPSLHGAHGGRRGTDLNVLSENLRWNSSKKCISNQVCTLLYKKKVKNRNDGKSSLLQIFLLHIFRSRKKQNFNTYNKNNHLSYWMFSLII